MDLPKPPGHTASVLVVRRVGRGRKCVVEFDDGSQIVVSQEAVEKAGLHRGAPVTAADIEELERIDRAISAHDAALRLLATRARSERELRTRLAMRGFDPESIDREIKRLNQAGLINDSEFATAWVAQRQLNAPRSKRMLQFELLGRGIDPTHAAEAVASVNDRAIALDLARRRARSWRALEQSDFTTRLGSFLQRRGFAFDVATEAASAAWDERQNEQESMHG